MIAFPLLSQLEWAKNGLEDARIAYCGAVTAHAEAKCAVEVAGFTKMVDGVDGRNEKERTARLRRELAPEYAVLADTEDALNDARCSLEVAKLEWELAQYKVRAIELATPTLA